MWSEVLVRYLHFLGIILLTGALVSEHILLKEQMSRLEIKKWAKVDAFVGIGALIAMLAGLTLWIGVGKPKEFYTQNPVMHIKLTLFMLVAALSIWPSIWFFKNKKGEGKELLQIPSKFKWILRIELMCLVALPFCATLLARGIGL